MALIRKAANNTTMTFGKYGHRQYLSKRARSQRERSNRRKAATRAHKML